MDGIEQLLVALSAVTLFIGAIGPGNLDDPLDNGSDIVEPYPVSQADRAAHNQAVEVMHGASTGSKARKLQPPTPTGGWCAAIFDV